MDFYIVSPKMQDRIIKSILERNNEEFKIEYVESKNFYMHFNTSSSDFNEVYTEVKRRMKEDGVAKLIIYQIIKEII